MHDNEFQSVASYLITNLINAHRRDPNVVWAPALNSGLINDNIPSLSEGLLMAAADKLNQTKFDDFDINQIDWINAGRQFAGAQQEKASILCYALSLLARNTKPFNYDANSQQHEKPAIQDLSKIKDAGMLGQKFIEAIHYLCSNSKDIGFYLEFYTQLKAIRRSHILDALEYLPAKMRLSVISDFQQYSSSGFNANPFHLRFSLHSTFASGLLDGSTQRRIQQMCRVLLNRSSLDEDELSISDLEQRANYYQSIGKRDWALNDRTKAAALRAASIPYENEFIHLIGDTRDSALKEPINNLQRAIASQKLDSFSDSYTNQINYYRLIKCRYIIVSNRRLEKTDPKELKTEAAELIYDLHRCDRISPASDMIVNGLILGSRKRLRHSSAYSLVTSFSADFIYECILLLKPDHQLEVLRSIIEDPNSIWRDKLQPLLDTINDRVKPLEPSPAEPDIEPMHAISPETCLETMRTTTSPAVFIDACSLLLETAPESQACSDAAILSYQFLGNRLYSPNTKQDLGNVWLNHFNHSVQSPTLLLNATLICYGLADKCNRKQYFFHAVSSYYRSGTTMNFNNQFQSIIDKPFDKQIFCHLLKEKHSHKQNQKLLIILKDTLNGRDLFAVLPDMKPEIEAKIAEIEQPAKMVSAAPAAILFTPPSKPEGMQVKPIPEAAAKRLAETANFFDAGL